MSDKLININLVIADRPYPLKIRPSEEEKVRKAAKDINAKVTDFQNQYAAKDKQDYLAMACLMYAVEVLGYKNKTTLEDSSLARQLEELDRLLSGKSQEELI